MTKEQALNSLELKRRFVKDNNLPITVYHEPYFTERLQILDRLFGCVDKFDLFCNELASFNDEQEYFAHYNTVKDTAIEYIKAKDEFKVFTDDNSFIRLNNQYPKGNLYTEENQYKAFISIDMKKANFSAVKRYNSAIFDDANTWEEFIMKFTTMQHIANSKYIRQVILGACNPKKQIQFELYLMHTLLEFIKHMVPGIEVFSLGVDEIILYHPNQTGIVKNDETAQHIVDEIRNALNRHVVGHMVRMEEFYLEPLANYGYLKVNMHDETDITFKCVDAECFHQHVKHYYGMPITDNDLVFYHNNVLAKFLEPIPNYLNPIANS
jgi:hypothetical protein